MDPLATTLGLIIAIVMIAAAAYFAWMQHLTLRVLNFNTALSSEERRFSLGQCWRRLFGSLVLVLLAGMLAGALFLEYDPRNMSRDEVRFLTFYVMTMLLLLLVIMVLAVFDFWATTRHTMAAQKELLREQQEILEAELEEHQHRQSGEQQ